MGHASQIALGVALRRPERRVVVLDGDGAAIMHLGGLTSIGTSGARNLTHVVLNNGAHDSVGGQPTAGFQVDMVAIAKACGYAHAARAQDREELGRELERLSGVGGPALLEVRVRRGARGDLGRPTRTPQEAKRAFREWIG